MNHYAILKWYLTAGITQTIGEIPINRLCASTEKTMANVNKMISKPKEPQPILNTDSFVAQAEQTVQKSQTLDELKNNLLCFEGCSLKKTAKHTFFGTGQTQNPTVFCIFDTPQADADKSGNLFTGDIGTRLKKMLIAINLSIQTNTYVAPLIPWRLPGDRNPTESEIQICLPFVKKQIELVQPHFLLLFGTTVSKALLGFESISKARQKIHSYPSLRNDIPAVVTFGPKAVSKSESDRRYAWDDLQKFQKIIQQNL